MSEDLRRTSTEKKAENCSPADAEGPVRLLTMALQGPASRAEWFVLRQPQLSGQKTGKDGWLSLDRSLSFCLFLNF